MLASQTAFENILSKIQHWKTFDGSDEQSTDRLPFVTVTFAQTLDGMIAASIPSGSDGNELKSANLKISCEESMTLTHALRSIHDAVLVGGNTFGIDNPRLNNRLWFETNGSLKQPVPVVLDTELRQTLRLIRQKKVIRASSVHDKIVVCCSNEALAKHEDYIMKESSSSIRLLGCGRKIGNQSKDNHEEQGLDINDMLQKLRKNYGIESVMVEGGASILSSFMAQPGLVGCVCMTISPKLIGGKFGLNAFRGNNFLENETEMFEFCPSSILWAQVGSDCIFLAKCHETKV